MERRLGDGRYDLEKRDPEEEAELPEGLTDEEAAELAEEVELERQIERMMDGDE